MKFKLLILHSLLGSHEDHSIEDMHKFTSEFPSWASLELRCHTYSGKTSGRLLSAPCFRGLRTSSCPSLKYTVIDVMTNQVRPKNIEWNIIRFVIDAFLQGSSALFFLAERRVTNHRRRQFSVVSAPASGGSFRRQWCDKDIVLVGFWAINGFKLAGITIADVYDECKRHHNITP